MYDLTYDGGFRCLFELDVGQLLQKYWVQRDLCTATPHKGPSFISSQPSWQKENIPEDEKESEATLEPGTAVLGLCFIRNPEQPSAGQSAVSLHESLFGSQIGAAIK